MVKVFWDKKSSHFGFIGMEKTRKEEAKHTRRLLCGIKKKECSKTSVEF